MVDFQAMRRTYSSLMHCFLSEFGTKNQQPKEYAGAAGFVAFTAEMKRRGVQRELEMMFKDNPAKAIGLP